MTDEEKFDAIIERLKFHGKDLTPQHLSIIMINGYLDILSREKIVVGERLMTSMGENVLAVCEEFDWRPSQDDIIDFVLQMVDIDNKEALITLLVMYRDDPIKFLESAKKAREEND